VRVTNASKVAADLDATARRQIPYATAVALTRVSQDAKAELRSGLRHYFTIRNGWVSRGIVNEPARKSTSRSACCHGWLPKLTPTRCTASCWTKSPKP
jgi:hypothetical protein